MKKITAIISLMVLAAIAGCSTPNRSNSTDGASNATVLIITAKNMNASMSSKEINNLMDSEVSTFSKSLNKALKEDGKEASLRAFESASESDIAMEIARMQKKPGLLIQVYWTAKQNNSLYIVVDSLKIKYRDSGKSVNFASLDRREYLSIGLSAKPSDTPENHAKHYSMQLKTVRP